MFDLIIFVFFLTNVLKAALFSAATIHMQFN
jgi:hypothetical protein